QYHGHRARVAVVEVSVTVSTVSTESTVNVFVYGSLKRGGENHRHLRYQSFVCEARTAPRYRLYMLDGYPGMVEDAERGVAVRGEIWEVDADCLRRLDLLEGLHVGLYKRIPVHLESHAHAPHGVVTYLYNRPVAGCADLGDHFPVPPPPPSEKEA